jgi:hypothetical protein
MIELNIIEEYYNMEKCRKNKTSDIQWDYCLDS